MPINTDNVTGLTVDRSRTGMVWIRMIKSTHVGSAGREPRGGEELQVSADDARWLIARGKAEKLQRPVDVPKSEAEFISQAQDAAQDVADGNVPEIAPDGSPSVEKVESDEDANDGSDEDADDAIGITLTGADRSGEESGRRFPGRRRSR